jgi:hypothetical protein
MEALMNYVNYTLKIFLNAVDGADEVSITLHYELLHDCFFLEKILLSSWIYINTPLHFPLLRYPTTVKPSFYMY